MTTPPHPPAPIAMAHARPTRRLCLERALFALAGTVTLVSVIGVLLLSPWFALLALAVAGSQWAYVLVGACPASLVLTRAFGIARCAR